MDAPFLPPPVADNPAPKKKSSSFVIWLVLIVGFIALYNVASAHSADDESLWWRALTGIGWLLYSGWPFLLIGAVFTWLWRLGRAARPFNLAQEPALVALADGRFEDAAAGFREIAGRFRRHAEYASVARYNLAITLRRQGKHQSAIAELIAVEKGAGLLYGSETRLLAAIGLAENYALVGQLEAAQKWLEEARKRLQRAGHRNLSACMVRLAESVIHCRAGRFDEALRGLERDWRQLEGNLALPHMRVAWLMRAYATAQLGGPRGEGAATPYLTMLRGAPLDHLAAEWPELRTFLAAQSL